MQAIIEAAQLKEEGKVKKVVVTGCLAQRYSEELAGGGCMTCAQTGEEACSCAYYQKWL